MTRCTVLLVVAISGWLTSTVHAHMIVEGAGDLANGALHPAVTPAHALVIVGLGLLIGQRLPLDMKTPARVCLPVSAAALALTALKPSFAVPPPVLVGIAMAIGIAVGLETKLPRVVLGVVCAASALAVGLDSGLENATSPAATAKTLLGTWLAMNGAVFYIAACASNAAGKPWARTAVRVLGSWIVAISLLVLAFSLRK